MDDLEQKATDALKEELGKRLKETAKLKETPKPRTPKKENISNLTGFLTVIMISLSAVIFYTLFLMKKESPQKKIIPIVPDHVIIPSNEISLLRNRVEKLTAQNKRLSDQIWLLGLQANQNAVMLKSTNPEIAGRVVELTEDWKLNKKPDSVKIKTDHLNKLNDFIAKEPYSTAMDATAEMPESTTYEE